MWVRLAGNSCMPQLKTTLLRQSIQIRQISENHISFSFSIAVMFARQDPGRMEKLCKYFHIEKIFLF
jgi:hypothetical protein